IQKELNRINRSHRVQDTAQHVSLLQKVCFDQELFLACAGTQNINRREYALVRNLAIQNDFRVTGSLELFENDFVHAAARVDQGSRNNGERSAFLNIARGTKEPLWSLQGVGIHTTGQNF